MTILELILWVWAASRQVRTFGFGFRFGLGLGYSPLITHHSPPTTYHLPLTPQVGELFELDEWSYPEFRMYARDRWNQLDTVTLTLTLTLT